MPLVAHSKIVNYRNAQWERTAWLSLPTGAKGQKFKLCDVMQGPT